ncbi:MAG: hypothetical protein JKY94_12865 [Rhodobacteraceae bacterium]|nr:hypothetical protein [Paracoccaceae bacterium]
MSFDLILLIGAIGLGAMLQVGIGIGFSIIVGPLMFVQIGTQAAVPLLLLLNVVVSVIAVPGTVRATDWPVVKSAALACVVGILAGIAIYPLFSEAMVLAIAGGLLVIGALSTVLPASAAGKRAFLPICGLSGLATVWAATPGPLMALGLILSDYPAAIVRKLVQPIALIGYSVAFGLHAIGGFEMQPMVPLFVVVTVLAVWPAVG